MNKYIVRGYNNDEVTFESIEIIKKSDAVELAKKLMLLCGHDRATVSGGEPTVSIEITNKAA